MTEDIHLDIAHHARREYRYGKQIRVHPWLGPTLNTCKIVYDPQHLLDFIQASVRGQFDRAEYVFERAQKQYHQARKIWNNQQDLSDDDAQDQSQTAAISYLRALGHAANAIASLSGPPLTERRLLLQFQSRAEAIGKPGLHSGLLGLLGAPNLQEAEYQQLVDLWTQMYQECAKNELSSRLHLARKAYYAKAFAALLKQQIGEAILWPLSRTATLAMELMGQKSQAYQLGSQLLAYLGLQGEALGERMLALDAYLDLIEETLEQWAEANGVVTPFNRTVNF